MKEPKWLSTDMVLAIHDEALAAFGGALGVRDGGLLESALARARQRLRYDRKADLFDLVAASGVGIVKNHPFVDGNKRTALLSTRAFLFLNRWILEPAEAEEVQVMLGVATGRVDAVEFAVWLRANATPQRFRRAKAR
jgi:death-on-curing protein